MNEHDRSYFLLRAETERRLAQDATTVEAMHAHSTLAERYLVLGHERKREPQRARS